MPEIPHAPLSDALEARVGHRRLVSAVFLTYKFDPAFFEQEVLPVLFDGSFSHVAAIRLLQLEEPLRELKGEIAVYYDAKGLIATGSESAKLDAQRIPVIHSTGIFHPKNIFLLLESAEPHKGGRLERSLCVACLSANLTRAGWWENVEACHFEEIREGDRTLLKDDLIEFLNALKRRALAAGSNQRALDDVLAFLKRNTDQRVHRSTADALHTRFYNGKQPVTDFLEAAAGDRLYDGNLEVISPYFDDADVSAPLEALIERFRPKEVRVLLPRGQSGEVLCREALFKSVCEHPGVSWGKLPPERTRAGRGEDVPPRFVHAKVYRFFSRTPARELLFVGSANLTSAAHQRGGNLESGFLVETKPNGRPGFWLELERREPTSFDVRPEADEVNDSWSAPLALRYDWRTQSAEAFWLESAASPAIILCARGETIGQIESLPARTWVLLPEAIADRLNEILKETSFVQVKLDDADQATILVQEKGMAHKPSLLLQLSLTDILRYWAMLSPAQRAAFIEAKWPKGSEIGDGADLVTQLQVKDTRDTLFDRFAGFFHAFSSLEKSVRQALTEKRTKDASYRLFGNKYDSLPTLLGHLSSVEEGDDVERYVIVLCATQLVNEIQTKFPGFWSENPNEVEALSRQISDLKLTIRQALVARAPDSMGEFLDWFDRWFIKRAEPMEAQNV
jgi:hypothetical protein